MPSPARLLLVEDDPAFAERMRRLLKPEEFETTPAKDGLEALEKLRTAYFDLVVTDVKMPRLTGIELLQRIRSGEERDVDRETPVVVLSSVDDLATAIEAMRLGAADYVTKDSERAEILMKLRRALERSRLLNENRLLRDQVERHARSAFGEIVGNSPSVQALKEEIALVAPHAWRVLVTGETGVGKELVARALHAAGPSPRGPFVEVNCAALPDENLFQSELFGHEQGSFTGATQQRKGRFELADEGTLFLDEIGELTAQAQAKLLRAIETRQFTRLGGTKAIQVNCRLVFATHRDLAAEVKKGTFREDLFYRINVVHLRLTPLRERRGDIAPLASAFLDQFRREYRRPNLLVTSGALERLRTYDWPGNIRELRNVLERLVLRSRTDTIESADLAAIGLGMGESAGGSLPFALPEEGVDLEKVERDLVEAALIRANWSQKDAALLLNISADRLNARVKKFGFRHESWRRHK